MKIAISIFVTSILLVLSGAWLYVLQNGAAEEYSRIWESFSYTPPAITSILFGTLEYWWAVWLFLVAISFAPLFVGQKKRYGLPMLVSAIILVLLVATVYGPTLFGNSLV